MAGRGKAAGGEVECCWGFVFSNHTLYLIYGSRPRTRKFDLCSNLLLWGRCDGGSETRLRTVHAGGTNNDYVHQKWESRHTSVAHHQLART